jgi:hypothetical protein
MKQQIWTTYLYDFAACIILFSILQFNNRGPGQPDGTVRADGFGNEACTALLEKNGVFKWYDEPCNTRRQLICEDLPVPNINFVRNQNPGVNIP